MDNVNLEALEALLREQPKTAQAIDAKAPFADCATCPLRDEPIVYGNGPDKADIVITGEAPGRDEVRSGIPFIGKAGQLLNKVLNHHGINRDEVYTTNTVLCRPPGNRTPTANEVKHCRERLVHEVKARSPEKVLAVGAVAAKAILGTTEGITSLRLGGPKQSDELGASVVPTFHTAAALRNPDLFPAIVEDCKKLASHITVGWEPTNYKVADERTAEIMFRRQLEYTDLLSLDIEIDVPYDRHQPRFLCIGISHKPGTAVVYPERVLDRIKHRLTEGFKSHRWLMQNGKYDTQFLWGYGIPTAKVDEDSMLMHYATNEIKGTHDLEQLATEILGAPFYKKEAKSAITKNAPLSFLEPETLYQYNATDADVTYRLLEPLHKEMTKDGVTDVYNTLLIPGSNALAHMEYRGVRIDQDKLNALEEELSSSMYEREKRLSKWVDNPRSPMQVKAALERMLGHEILNTSAAVLQGIAENYNLDFVDDMLEYRAHHKILSTYVKGLKKHIIRGIVHPTFLLHGTESGRLSCRRPNLQNIPIDHPVRECYTASDEDHVLLEADYGQVEFRLAAIFSGDPWLLEQFRAGRSLHKETANALFGPDHSAREYVHAKTVNFGILYGRQAKALAAQLKIPVYKAQAMIDSVFKRSPNLLTYRRFIEKEIDTRGHLTSAFGRKRRFWLVTSENRQDVYREGYNFPIQSAASDIMLTALLQLERFNPVITVHDSIIFDIHKDELEEAIVAIRETMENANPFDIPITVDFSWDYRWKIKKT